MEVKWRDIMELVHPQNEAQIYAKILKYCRKLNDVEKSSLNTVFSKWRCNIRTRWKKAHRDKKNIFKSKCRMVGAGSPNSSEFSAQPYRPDSTTSCKCNHTH